MHNDVVNDVFYAGLVMRGDILGVERRRRWGDEEKLEIVLSVGVGGATVTQVAQRHEITRQQIYAWRHELKKKGLLSALPEALFLPVDLDRPMELAMPTAAICAEAPRPAQIELQLASGRCLRFDPTLEMAMLTQVIRAVEGA
ncbi:MAG: transposase [Roseibium aggregatum]